MLTIWASLAFWVMFLIDCSYISNSVKQLITVPIAFTRKYHTYYYPNEWSSPIGCFSR